MVRALVFLRLMNCGLQVYANPKGVAVFQSHLLRRAFGLDAVVGLDDWLEEVLSELDEVLRLIQAAVDLGQ